MTKETAEALLTQLMTEPFVSEQVKKSFFSDDCSNQLKRYSSGEQKGYHRGHEAGFAQGVALGLPGALDAVVLRGVATDQKFMAEM